MHLLPFGKRVTFTRLMYIYVCKMRRFLEMSRVVLIFDVFERKSYYLQYVTQYTTIEKYTYTKIIKN